MSPAELYFLIALQITLPNKMLTNTRFVNLGVCSRKVGFTSRQVWEWFLQFMMKLRWEFGNILGIKKGTKIFSARHVFSQWSQFIILDTFSWTTCKLVLLIMGWVGGQKSGDAAFRKRETFNVGRKRGGGREILLKSWFMHHFQLLHIWWIR
jgi:hypothetical protein